MRAAIKRQSGLNVGAVAAALVVAALAITSASDSRAQNPKKVQHTQKKAPPKAAVQQFRKNAIGAPKGPAGIQRGQALGTKALTPNARITPNTGNLGRPRRRRTRPAIRRQPQAPGNGTRNAPSETTSKARAPLSNNRPGGFGNRLGNAPNNRLGARGFTNRDPRLRAVNAATPQLRQVQRVTHRAELFAIRSRMPVRPLPGERNFTGVPPVEETRFVTTEMVCQWGPDMSQAAIEEIARRHDLTIVAIQRSVLTGGTLVHFRIGGNRAARDVVRAMEAEQIVSQPNYVYDAVQDPAAAQSSAASGEQYVANKLRLAEVHKIATGKDVVVAVIDSEIDKAHPEFAKAIAEEFDAVGQPDKPHLHGTGMAGAIVSQSRLMGIAPGARTLAIHAFSTGAAQSPQATTQTSSPGSNGR